MTAMSAIMLKQVQQLNEISEMVIETALKMSQAAAPHLGNLIDIQA